MKEERKVFAKDLTPNSMSCGIGACPGIYEFESNLNSLEVKQWKKNKFSQKI